MGAPAREPRRSLQRHGRSGHRQIRPLLAPPRARLPGLAHFRPGERAMGHLRLSRQQRLQLRRPRLRSLRGAAARRRRGDAQRLRLRGARLQLAHL